MMGFFGFDSDYVANPELDRYSDADLDDEEYGEMDMRDRRDAEAAMARRDRGQASGRLGRRSKAPAFLLSSDDDMAGDGLLDGIDSRRRRRHYDERRDVDDMEGEEDVSLSFGFFPQ